MATLVTGAAGRVGAVGHTITELLLKQGKAVRAMVRNEDERAQALRDMGAEVVVGDLLDLHSMHRVIAGCETMYFGMSVSDDYLAATVNAAAVARHHGVKAFVNMSQMTVSQMSITETTPSPQHKLHWLAEQALNWSGLPVVHVRPTVFMENFFLLFAADSVREFDQIRLPLGNGKTSPVAVEDIARVLTTLLAGPMLGDRVTARQWIAVVLGFAGVLVIMRPGGGVLSLPAVFPLATAIVFSIYQIITRKLSGREHPYTTLFYTAVVGAVVTSFVAPLNWVTPTWAQAALMACVGVLGGTGHLLLIRAMEYASPSTLAPYVYSQLVWSTVLAYLAFGDFPQKVTLVGMLVIVAAGLLAVNWSQMRRRSDAADQARTHGD